MLSEINLLNNASFHKITKRITAVGVNALFDELSSDKVSSRKDFKKEIRVVKNYKSKKYIYSLLVFKYKEVPSFMPNSTYREMRFAYLMLIECDDFLVVFKKNISRLDKFINEYSENVDYEDVQKMFTTDLKRMYEKLTSMAMGTSKFAVHKKTLEAKDLTGQISSFSSKRSIPGVATVKATDGRYILRPDSSKIMKIGGKTNFEGTLEWVSFVINELSKQHLSNDFYDKFAKPIKFEDFILLGHDPLALSIDTSEIDERLENGDFIKFRNSRLSNYKFKKFIELIKSEFLIKKNGAKYEVLISNHTQVPVTFTPIGELKYFKKSLGIRSSLLKYLSFESDNASVQSMINSDQSFMVSFDNIEYVYTMKRVFQDRGIKTYLDELLNILIPHDFTSMISEKGNLPIGQNHFDANSVFGEYENNIRLQNSVMVCDDFGDEWADYIEFDGNQEIIRFSHLKYGKRTTSASDFHEVVGQGLKNLGRLSLDQDEFLKKIHNKWIGKYKDKQRTSSLERIRGAHTYLDVINEIDNLRIKSSLRREVCLVVSFVSKTDLDREFLKIKNNQTVRPHINQLVWILMSFVYTCKEQGAIPILYCDN